MEAGALISELKRRRVIRALVGYGIAAFAVLQIIEPVMHGLHWPDEVLSYVVVALAVGFPVVVSLAWIFDVRSGGTERMPASTSLKGAGLALVLICIGALAAAPGLFWYFVLPGRVRVAAAAAPSIAVLPFLDMSPGKDQEYFSDGVAEEILDALAHIDGLHVAGRTSSFSFKGKGDDLRSIGEKLNVANILEGSVRKEGNRVRITAQLVNAGTGFHVWSETYDRELAGVFSAQDEIASAVVAALKVKLLPARAAIDEQRTASAEAHDQYLSGRHFYERGSAEGYDRAVQALEKAVALDPGYAPAWAALSLAHFNAYDRIPSRHNAQEMLRARAAADKAIALAPDFAGGYSARGNLRVNWDYDWSGARADLERALSLNPGDTDVLTSYAWLLSTLGKLPEAIAAGRKAIALDPLSSENWTQLGAHYLGTGDLNLAEEAAKRALDISPEHSWAARNLGFTYLLQGRFAEARAAFQRSSEFFRLMGEALVEYELGHGAEAHGALAQMLAMPEAIVSSYQIAQVYAWRGEADGTFEWLEKAYRQHDGGLDYLNYDPFLRKVRSDPRYMGLLKKMNLSRD